MENSNTWTIKWLIFRQFFGQPIQCDAGAVSEHFKSSQTRYFTKIHFFQKYSPFFAFSPNQYLCHKVCLGECMYCRAYTPSPKKALKCHWRNEILLAQHIPYQQSNPTFDQEHQHILQECNNMWQIFPLSKHTVLICVHVWRQTEGWRRRC